MGQPPVRGPRRAVQSLLSSRWLRAAHDARRRAFLPRRRTSSGPPCPCALRLDICPFLSLTPVGRLTRWAAARTNESQLAGGRRFKLAVCAVTPACSRRFQRAIARVLGRANSHSSHHGLSTTCRTCAPHPSVDARTNRQRSRTTGLLLPVIAIRAFVGMSSMSTDHLAAGAQPVFELRQLIVTALLCHAAAAPPEQPRQRREARPGGGLRRRPEAHHRGSHPGRGGARRFLEWHRRTPWGLRLVAQRLVLRAVWRHSPRCRRSATAC